MDTGPLRDCNLQFRPDGLAKPCNGFLMRSVMLWLQSQRSVPAALETSRCQAEASVQLLRSLEIEADIVQGLAWPGSGVPF